MLKKIRTLVLGALHLLANLTSHLGLRRIGALGSAIGNTMWYILPSRRRYTIETIGSRLEVSYDDAKRIAHASFRQNGRSFTELVMVPYFGFHITQNLIEIENPEVLEAIAQSKRPVVAFTGHIGAWELCAGLLGDFPQNKPRLIVVRRNGSPMLNNFINDMRGSRGVNIVDHRQAVFPVLRALKRSGVVAFLVDHNTSFDEALFLPFLGKTAAVNMGPALLALRAKALVWPFFLVRKGEKFVVLTEEPLDTATLEGDREQKIKAICTHYTQVMERVVRAYPEQWFWMHHRWKTQPHSMRQKKSQKENFTQA